MATVSIFDLTDADLTAAIAARRAHPEVVANIAANRALDARRRNIERRAEAQRIAQLRRCTRCGIDTTAPDVCADCVDVLALECAS